jgi:hypothetical protein
MVKGLKPGITA